VPSTREGIVVAEMGGQTGIFGIENFEGGKVEKGTIGSNA